MKKFITGIFTIVLIAITVMSIVEITEGIIELITKLIKILTDFTCDYILYLVTVAIAIYSINFINNNIIKIKLRKKINL